MRNLSLFVKLIDGVLATVQLVVHRNSRSIITIITLDKSIKSNLTQAVIKNRNQ